MHGLSLASPINWSNPLNRGLLRWWLHVPMVGQGATWRELNRRSDMTISGALARGPAGRPGGFGCRQFDGFDDYAKTAATIDLTGTTTLSVSFWLYWNSFISNDDFCLESSADYNSNTDGIVFNPNSSSGSNFFIGIKTSGGYNVSQFTRPSAAAWHHYVTNFDRNAGAQQVTHVYVDGVAQSLSNTFTNSASGAFGNFVWNFMSRNGASSFGAGRMDDVRIYNRVLPAWEVRALLHASRRGYPQELRWSRGVEFGGYEPAAVPPAGGALASLCDWDWSNKMSVDTYHNVQHGALEAIGSTALQLSASTRKLHKGVTILANSSNGQTVWIGTSAVTPGTVAATDGLPLTAGQSIAIPVDMLSRVYVVAASGSNKVHFWGS